MTTTTIQLPDDLNAWLEVRARETKRPKVDIIRTALEKERSAHYASALDGLHAVASSVDSPALARNHKADFRKAMLQRHAKDHR